MNTNNTTTRPKFTAEVWAFCNECDDEHTYRSSGATRSEAFDRLNNRYDNILTACSPDNFDIEIYEN